MNRKLVLLAFILSVLGINAKLPDGNDVENVKVTEITRIISLGAIQKLKEAYVKYKAACDSAYYKIKDIPASVSLIYQTKKQFHETVIKTLTEEPERVQQRPVQPYCNLHTVRTGSSERTGY